MSTSTENNDEHKERVLASSPAWEAEKPVPRSSKYLGVVSLILALVFFSPAAVFLGHESLKAYNRGETSLKAKKIGLTGLIIGYIGLGPWLYLLLAFFSFMSPSSNWMG